jgi:hypothetical protein
LRVLALGGAGRVGRRAVGILASSSLVSEIVIAGRNLEAAQSCAKDTGEKARAVSVDISNKDRLVTLARDCDILVNTAGPEFEVVLKALGAAIMAGTNYCDISAYGPTMEKALELDSAAKAKGVTALMGIGHAPGLTNLMMMHAARQLDSAEEVRTCVFAPASVLGMGWTKEQLRRSKETGQVDASWQLLVKLATPPFHVYRGGAFVTVETKVDEMKIAMPGNGEIPALLVGSTETITIPRSIPGIRNVYALWSWFPFQLNDQHRELGGRVTSGELELSQAGVAFFNSIVAEYDRKQAVPSGLLGDFAQWAEATGIKNGRRARYSCWPASMHWVSTAPALALASLKILGGEVRTRGVLAPESCLDPLPFFRDVACHVLKSDEPGKILNESWQTL